MMRSSVTAIIFLTNNLFAQSFDFVNQAGRNGLEFDHDHGGSGEKFYVEIFTNKYKFNKHKYACTLLYIY